MNSKFFVDARFYTRSGPYNLTEVAAVINGIAAKSDHVLSGVAPLQTAGSNEVSFLVLLCQKTTGSFMFHFIIRNPY